jgi:PAS domain S-box-containing protein
MQSVCEATVKGAHYAFSYIGYAEDGPDLPIRVVARAGRCQAYADGLDISWSPELASGRGPAGHAIRSRQSVILRDMREDPTFGPWRQRAAVFGLRSSVTVPFERPGASPGVLAVYSTAPDAFGPDEMALFEQLGEELSFALTVEADRARLKQTEAALSSALTEYQLLADNIADLVVHVHKDGRIRYASPSCGKLGYGPGELVGRKALDLIHPDDHERTARHHEAIFAGAPIDWTDREARVLSASGDWVWFEGNPKAIVGPDGEITGFVSLMRDVTQRRAFEEELRQRRREAEAASEAKSDFLANMSHEIRTPLTAMLGFAGLLEHVEGLPVDAQRYAQRIASGGQALLTVIDDILDFAKIEAGEIELVPRPFDPRRLLDEVVGLVSISAADKSLLLGAEVTDRVPAHVLGDAGRLRQVLLNLLSNAVKFTSEGGVTVAMDYDATAPASLRVSVADTGVGIPADKGERLFERFRQADESVSRRFGGVGLGLALCKNLVGLMGGAIGYDSQPGVGSTFWFRVPAPTAAGSSSEARPPDLAATSRGGRVLVVDDVAANRELLETVLRAVGYEVVTARDGGEAIDRAMATPFDIILMDLQMPGMDGFAATSAIRLGAGGNVDTPIIALSANALPEHVERCRQIGMNGHIAKPIIVGDLVRDVALFIDDAT